MRLDLSIVIQMAVFALLFASLASTGYAQETSASNRDFGTTVRLRSGGVDYIFYKTERSTAAREDVRRALAEFDHLFRELRANLFQSHGVREPGTMSVALAGDAEVFRRLTGRPWYVAGLYEPPAKRLVFQNPVALRRRGILRSTLVHELCHVLISEAADQMRRENSSQAGGDGNLRGPVWLEEGYCEALSRPTCVRESAAIHRRIRATPDLSKLVAWLESRFGNSGSSNRSTNRNDWKQRGLAFCVASLFVADWSATVGQERAFSYLIGDGASLTDAKDFEELRRHYKRFRNKFVASDNE